MKRKRGAISIDLWGKISIATLYLFHFIIKGIKEKTRPFPDGLSIMKRKRGAISIDLWG